MIRNNDASPGTSTTPAGLAYGGKHGGGTCPMVDEYEALMPPARQRFDEHPAVAALFRDRLEIETLEAFLIYFCALGVGMTEPVDQWIRRAGRKCGEFGDAAIGWRNGSRPELESRTPGRLRERSNLNFSMKAEGKQI
jgi:hypothetical protein